MDIQSSVQKRPGLLNIAFYAALLGVCTISGAPALRGALHGQVRWTTYFVLGLCAGLALRLSWTIWRYFRPS